MSEFCTDPRHDEPCPLPCTACDHECGQKDEEDRDEDLNPSEAWQERSILSEKL